MFNAVNCFSIIVSPLITGSLQFISAMASISGVIPLTYQGLYLRAPVEFGNSVMLEYTIGYFNDHLLMTSLAPEIQWLRNGRPFRVQPAANVSN